MSPGEEIALGGQGRIVIPATLRKALHLKQGDTLVAWVEGDRLLLESRRAISADLVGALRRYAQGLSPVEELLSERRAEAAREDTG